MRVAVVGAGISGLGAARALTQEGHEAIVYEKAPVVGGRLETIRIGEYVFDTGATAIAPRGRALEKLMMEELPTEGLCKIDAPIYVHHSLRVSPGDPVKNRIERYCYMGGNVELALRTAADLDVRLESKVEALEETGQGYRVAGEEYDGVILAVPIPEAARLLATVGQGRPFSNSAYRPCLSVLLGFAVPPPSVPYHAILDPENGHPLSWLSIESRKCPWRSPDRKTSLVAQMGPQFSNLYFEADEAFIVEATTDIVVRLYGKAWEGSPEVAAVKRWRYSQPEMTALFDNVNRPGSRILIAGDGVMGGRTEYAYDAGIKAARMMEETA
jgi:renalase